MNKYCIKRLCRHKILLFDSSEINLYTSYKKWNKFQKYIFLICSLSSLCLDYIENTEGKSHLGKVILQIL